MTRERYLRQLQELRDATVAMSRMVDKAIGRSTTSLVNQDVRLAKEVVIGDRTINIHRWKIEEQALLIIAMQAPIASDLRSISAVIHNVIDLERMADHAVGIAKIAIQTAEEPPLKPLVDLPCMSEMVRGMLRDAILAFVDADEVLARSIIPRDHDVDIVYDQVYRELLTYMTADPVTINRATRLLWAAHNFERIGDRVTNICEQVVFAVTGELEELAVPSF